MKSGNLDKKNTLLIIGAAVAFLVVLTVLILLALKFDIFGVQNPQPTTAPTTQNPAVQTPVDTEKPNDTEKNPTPDNPENPEGDSEEDDDSLKVDVDEEEDKDVDSEQIIDFDDLLNAANKNNGQ